MKAWWKRLWATIKGWFETQDPVDQEPSDGADDDAAQAESHGGKQVAITWKNDAAYRQMNDLARGVDMETFRRRVKETIASGANTLNLYLLNVRDGQPVPTSFYAVGQLGNAIDESALDLMRAKILAAIDLGILHINYWLLPDDGGVTYGDRATITRYISDVAERFGDLIQRSYGYIVICLESNECLSISDLDVYAKAVKTTMPFAKVANHMTSGVYSWSKTLPSIDCHFHQTEPHASVADFDREIRAVVAGAGKPVIACEFSLVGTDGTAKDKAKRALAAGCLGVHSGVPG